MYRPLLHRPQAFRFACYFFACIASVYLVYFWTTSSDFDRSILTSPKHAPPSPSAPSLSTNLVSPPAEPRILLVSALFPLAKSKHTHEDYEQWLAKFLKSITTPIYFYAPPSLSSMILSLRGSLPIYLNTTFTSPFDITPLQGLGNAYKHLHTIDREASYHNFELYAVWNAKPWLLDTAIKHLKQQKREEYDYAFWNDAGSFRDEHVYTKWPNPNRVEDVWNIGVERVVEALGAADAGGGGAMRESRDRDQIKNDLLFFPFTGMFDWTRRYWKEDDGPVDVDISEGSFFGGSPRTVSWWSETYYTYHDYYLRKGYFVGKDQTLINALFLLFPDRIFGIWLDNPDARSGIYGFDVGPMGKCGPPWWYYQWFLAADEERSVMSQKKWLKEPNGGSKLWFWQEWEWWKRRQECKLTKIFWVKDQLLDVFGKGWGVKRNVVV